MYIQSFYAGNGKNFDISIFNGTITIKADGKIRKMKVRQGEITEKLEKTKKYLEEFREGKYYLWKDLKNYRIIQKIYYSIGQRRRKNGLYRIYSSIINNNWITSYIYTKNSRIYREVGYYDNKVKAYDIKKGDKEIKIYDINGKLWIHIIANNKIQLSEKNIFYNINKVKETDMLNIHCCEGNYFITMYDKNGKIKYQGQYNNYRRNGKWIVKYKEKYYVNDLEIPKKYYYARPENLDPKKILRIRNIELRTYMINKIGLENIIKKLNGKTIDILPDGSQELIALDVEGAIDDNQDKIIKILKVKDPSTGIYYCLRVPPNMTDCEKARRWTLYDDEGELNLVKET
jgi:hypothetical protein